MNPPAAAMANAIASGIVGERKRNFTSTLCQLVKMKISTTTAMTMPPIALPLRPFLAGAAGWDMLRLRGGRSPGPRRPHGCGRIPGRCATGRARIRTVVRRFGSFTGPKGPPPTRRRDGSACRSRSPPLITVPALRGRIVRYFTPIESTGADAGLTHQEGCQILTTAADLTRRAGSDFGWIRPAAVHGQPGTGTFGTGRKRTPDGTVRSFGGESARCRTRTEGPYARHATARRRDGRDGGWVDHCRRRSGPRMGRPTPVSYTHLRAHETVL